MRATYSTGLINVIARTDAEMEKVEAVVAALVELAYCEVAGEDDMVTLGSPGCTILEMEKDYKLAKKMAFGN